MATNKGRVFLSGTVDKQYTWEHISPQHIVAFIYSGEMTLTYGKDTLTFVAGDTVLVPKNQLTRVVKSPMNGEPFKVLTMLLPDEDLRKFYLDRPVLENWDENIAKQRPVKSHPLLTSFFGSMLSYFDVQDELPASIVSIKILEALTLIDEVDKRASSILGTFSEMGKIDLEKYMEEHYMFNLPLEKFAFLTGRSLTVFKSDFKKIFKTTPGKWLTEKRLNLAYYKLTTKKQKATEVYLSAGFENLSHFSFAFKKAFGYSPRSISSN
ncbi:AraC family transcriptional regulator [uncultured Imperialibacter sp.]|uniref:AraC family transcriptional regulator n=1 Tax=uncultured Imperialibacter sp. TaxID=1672639 RepID=UPI0030DCB747